MVQQHQRLVFSLALKMLADEEEAKDVVQETFIRVWQRLDDYDTQKSFTTWLSSTCEVSKKFFFGS